MVGRRRAGVERAREFGAAGRLFSGVAESFWLPWHRLAAAVQLLLVSLFPRRQASPAASRASTKSGFQPAPPRSLRPQPREVFAVVAKRLEAPLSFRGAERPEIFDRRAAGGRAWAAGRLATARNFRALERPPNTTTRQQLACAKLQPLCKSCSIIRPSLNTARPLQLTGQSAQLHQSAQGSNCRS